MCIRDRFKDVDVCLFAHVGNNLNVSWGQGGGTGLISVEYSCLLYTSDAADERSSVDLGGRRIIKKKKNDKNYRVTTPTIHEINTYSHGWL